MKSTKMTRDGALYGGLSALVLILVSADVVYFNTLETPPPAAAAAQAAAPPVAHAEDPAAACAFNEQIPPVANFEALVGPSDPVVGNPQASVTFIEFFDPNCPHCKHLHPVMDATLEKYGDKIRVVYKPVALRGWDHSIPQVAALLAAQQAGKFSEMLERQFDLQQPGGLSMDQLKQIARDLGMDAERMEQRIEGGVYQAPMDKIFQQGVDVGVKGVPTVLFNGRVVASNSRSVDCFSQFIEAAL